MPVVGEELTSARAGVTDVDASLEAQKITVKHDAAKASQADMLAALKKWGDAGGKAVSLAP